jgi:hypothetical protein
VGWGYGYFWPLYIFVAEAGPQKGAGYTVDPYQGRVVDFDAPDQANGKGTAEGEFTIARMIPPERAFQIAIDMIRRQDPEFDPGSYTIWASPFGTRPFLHSPYQPDAQYSEASNTIFFEFARKVQTFAGTEVSDPADQARIDLDALTGRVRFLIRQYLPEQPTPEVRISAEEAKRIALGCVKSLAALDPAEHKESHITTAALAYAYAAHPSWALSSDYPNCRLPVWYVTVIWQDFLPDLEKEPLCGGNEESIAVHAVTGEVLSHSWTTSDIVPVKVDQAYLDYYAGLPRQPLPWDIRIGGQMGGSWSRFYYPFPERRNGELYVKDFFAWLMGVRVELEAEGYLLRGLEDVQVPPAEVWMREGAPWFPLKRLAEASRAKVELDLRERWLKIDPQYPRVGW